MRLNKVLVLVVLVGILAFGAVGLVSAKALTQTPEPPSTPYWNGMGRMMGGSGILQPYMVDAFAKLVGQTSEEIQAQLDSGKTLVEIAIDLDYSSDEITQLMTDTRSAALDAAVAAGDLTEDQAQAIRDRWSQVGSYRNGTGSCGGMNLGRRGGMMRGWWGDND